MKKFVRVIAMVLVLASVFALMSSVAFAANSKKATNGYFYVDTGKSFWGKPTVKIKNTGSTTMTIVVHGYKTISALKPGKTTTITLQPNKSYEISWGGTFTANATGTISAGRAIKGIW